MGGDFDRIRKEGYVEEAGWKIGAGLGWVTLLMPVRYPNRNVKHGSKWY
jgi:hypothetical protein